MLNIITKENRREFILTGIIVFIAILLVVYGVNFIYNNFILKDDGNSSNKLVTLDINDSLIKNLRYPKATGKSGCRNYWEYKDITLESIDRDSKMLFSASGIMSTLVPEKSDIYYIEAKEIKNNFYYLFGPDTPYVDKSLTSSYCCFIGEYSIEENNYILNCSCSEATNLWWDNEIKLYKAEQKGDEIYTYFYVQPYLENLDEDGNYFLFQRQLDGKTTNQADDISSLEGFIKKVTKKNSSNEIGLMMANGEVSTYKFVFKKQSDGNYYFYSGEWK